MQMNTENPTECPYYLITRVGLSISTIMKKTFTEIGASEVKPGYIGILFCLWNTNGNDSSSDKCAGETGVKLVELGRCAGQEPSTMTGLIDRMERDGLVERKSDKTDRRSNLIVLTERGLSIRHKIMETVNQTMDQAMEGISSDEVEFLQNILQKILKNTNRGI